jgi:two-component system, cell cycle sensor histidine kinase and response regulator CckA
MGVWEWDLETGKVLWSDELYELLGLDPDDGAPLSFDAVRARIHPDDLPAWEESLRACLEEGVEHRVDIRLMGAKGLARWLAVYGDAERDASGQVSRMVGAVVDITAYKRAEEALETSAERFRSLVERTSEGFYLVEWEEPLPTQVAVEEQIPALYRGRIVECNDAFARMYGFQNGQQMLGKTILDLHGTDDRPENLAFLRAWIEAGYELRGAVSREVDREGRTVWFSNSLVGIIREGKLSRVWGSQLDVTDVRHAERVASRERHLSELVIHSLPGLFYLFDRGGRFVRWNRQLNVATGRSNDELAELHPLELFEGHEKTIARSRIEEAFESGSAQIEAHVVAKNGQRTPYLLTGQRVEVDARPMLVGVGLDLSEQRRLEQTQLQMQARLEQAQRLESIGRLAGGVAHDLNNLLSPILGYAELLRGAPGLDDEDREAAAGIEQASLRARNLIQQLLAFGRRQTLEFEVVGLNDLVSGFERLLRHTIPEHIRLEVQLECDLPPVLADPVQLEQVLMNIALNGAEAMPQGGRLVVSTQAIDLGQEPGGVLKNVFARLAGGLSVEPSGKLRLAAADAPSAPSSPKGSTKSLPAQPSNSVLQHTPSDEMGLAAVRYVVLTIRDEGSGMDDVTLSQIFDPFFSTKGDKGHGLGLSTVYGIVKQHEGYITVESETGAGTCFHVFLPAASDGLAENDSKSEELAPDPHGHETLLVVDDDPDVRRLLLKSIPRFGYRVLEASDGAAALERYGGTPVDLLVTDVVMPGLSGLDLAAEMMKRQPGLKTIFMTGYVDEVVDKRGELRDELRIVRKPFPIRTLMARIRAALDGR